MTDGGFTCLWNVHRIGGVRQGNCEWLCDSVVLGRERGDAGGAVDVHQQYELDERIGPVAGVGEDEKFSPREGGQHLIAIGGAVMKVGEGGSEAG